MEVIKLTNTEIRIYYRYKEKRMVEYVRTTRESNGIIAALKTLGATDFDVSVVEPRPCPKCKLIHYMSRLKDKDHLSAMVSEYDNPNRVTRVSEEPENERKKLVEIVHR